MSSNYLYIYKEKKMNGWEAYWAYEQKLEEERVKAKENAK